MHSHFFSECFFISLKQYNEYSEGDRSRFPDKAYNCAMTFRHISNFRVMKDESTEEMRVDNMNMYWDGMTRLILWVYETNRGISAWHNRNDTKHKKARMIL